jgi:hypothetical protein
LQQIQKRENGANAIASTRILDFRRLLEMTLNDLFVAKMDALLSNRPIAADLFNRTGQYAT